MISNSIERHTILPTVGIIYMVVFLIQTYGSLSKSRHGILKSEITQVTNMQLCPCVHHAKFRELTLYNSNSILGWIHMFKTNRRADGTHFS